MIFDWPHKDLNPNSRKHYQAKAKLRAKQKSDAFFITKSYGESWPEQTGIDIVFHPPNKRHRDLDNLLASCKGMIDGMCEALGINDKDLHPITLDWGEVIKGGKVEIKQKEQ